MKRACKENADEALSILRRNMNRLSADDYDRLYYFLRACRARLPWWNTVAKDLDKKAGRRRATKVSASAPSS